MEVKNDGMISIEEFWIQLSKDSPSFSRLKNLPFTISLVDGLNQYFGTFANHSIEKLQKNKIELYCSKCSNATKDLKDYICQSHIGVIKGSLEQATKKNIAATYSPNAEDGTCTIGLLFMPRFLKSILPSTIRK